MFDSEHTLRGKKMEGPRPRHAAVRRRRTSGLPVKATQVSLRSHEHERATIARYARARGHHPPIHRTGSGALKTMERVPDLFAGKGAVRDLPVFPYGQSPWPIFSQLAWQKPDRKGETDRKKLESPRFGTGNGACFHDGFSRTGFSLKWRETTLFVLFASCDDTP